jgi:hypothetical protein
MGKKFALNILYTIGVFLSVITLLWGFENKRYEYVLGAVFVGAIFIILKIKVLKEVKNLNKKP